MTAPDMVERVAKRLFDAAPAAGGSPFAPRTTWGSVHANRDYWRALARAAIAEMRTPTDGMTFQGFKAFDDCDDKGMKGGEIIAATFTAMIDTALEGK